MKYSGFGPSYNKVYLEIVQCTITQWDMQSSEKENEDVCCSLVVRCTHYDYDYDEDNSQQIH